MILAQLPFSHSLFFEIVWSFRLGGGFFESEREREKKVNVICAHKISKMENQTNVV